MTTTTTMHRLINVEAKSAGMYQEISWLEMNCHGGNTVSVFVPMHVAEAMAEAWEEADSFEPEPPTFDEALGAKCDEDARIDEARTLK